MAMVLKPQDVMVVLKLLALGRRTWGYAWLAGQLGMSPSQLHSAVKRALAALSDQQLYELLVLVDAIRGGRAREREISIKELKKRLEDYA